MKNKEKKFAKEATANGSKGKIFAYSVKDALEIVKELGVDRKKGLDRKVVFERQKKYGSNILGLKQKSAWHILGRQFCSAFIYLLLGAATIALFLREYVDSLLIFIFIAVNTMLGFLQEYHSEKTIRLLRKYTLPRSRVLRDGSILCLSSDKLVPGDIIILETGDRIPADVRFLEEDDLMIDETILTGESVPVYKQSTTLKSLPSAYHESLNLGFSGTSVLRGRAEAIVLATGKETAFGHLAKLAVETRKISDFEKGISNFSGFIIKLVGLTLLIVFLANAFIKRGSINILDLLIFSVALTVSVIPEALPLVNTFSLSAGAHRMAKKKVVVKRLSSIEDLGGIEILASDKTGTLTKNELSVTDVYSEDKKETLFLANAASEFELKSLSEPFDIALAKALSIEQKKRLKKAKKIAEEPFDPQTRRNIVLVNTGGRRRLIARGAPEVIMKMCSELTLKKRKEINNWIALEGRSGRRVLAVSFKDNDIKSKVAREFSSERNFSFAGVISFVDPIKPSSFVAVRKVKELGVRIVIITGDNSEVAGAVGHQIGLIESPETVVEGETWERMNRDAQNKCLDFNSVFARVSPEQKFKIIENLRDRYLVGFLGEGINDAPALKIAGVSLVVNSASDIAREAADIVLLSKNLEVILDGIKEGRRIFANTAKYIKSTLASNFGNFFAVATASMIIDFLPMLPIQILLLNLLSDTPMISISTDSVDKSELVAPKKYEFREIIIIAIVLGVVSTTFDFIFFSLFFRISPAVLRTNWFIGSVLTELALVFSIRTKSLFFKGSRPSSPMIFLSLIIIIISIGLPYTLFGQEIFRFTPPTPAHLALILGLVVVYFLCSETVKLFYYKTKDRRPA